MGLPDGAPPLLIRPGGRGDHPFIRALSIEVFSYLGDYGHIIPEWLAHDGVLTFVGERAGEALGFTLLGFYPSPSTAARGGGAAAAAGGGSHHAGTGTRHGAEPSYTADLLAIAVAPAAQRGGLGRRLLDHAIATARAARRQLPVRDLRLSVAEPNERARAMFAAAGFRPLPGEHGRYDGGQRALYLTLPL